MSFNEEDLDEFDSNEEAFIKMDLEEHDKETRRRACFDLIEKLSQTFPDKVGELVHQCQSAYMDEYIKDKNNYDKMIIVLNLIIASSVERYNFRVGAT